MSDQLSVIRKQWKSLLGDSLDRFLLIAGDILHEEELAIWMRFNPPTPSPRPPPVPPPPRPPKKPPAAAAKPEPSNGPV